MHMYIVDCYSPVVNGASWDHGKNLPHGQIGSCEGKGRRSESMRKNDKAGSPVKAVLLETMERSASLIGNTCTHLDYRCLLLQDVPFRIPHC
jgi:hypothetical protein